MKLDDILSLKFDKAVDMLAKDSRERDIKLWREQYDGDHKILRALDRQPYSAGPDGKVKTVIPTIITKPYQQIITDIAVAFLVGKPPKIVPHSDDVDGDAVRALMDIYRYRKLKYFNWELVSEVCIETKAAELWWVEDATGVDVSSSTADPLANKKFKVMLLSESRGSEIYAHFDDHGDMDAFTRKYNTTELVDGRVKNVEHADIYTADKFMYGKKIYSQWEIDEPVNPWGKIPVIYYDQNEPEWNQVQRMIDRMEIMPSRHGDTNDYNGHPLIKIRGKLVDVPDKTESGRLLQFEGVDKEDGTKDYGDAEYLSWDNMPESLKLEYDHLKDDIFSLSQTPDISFQNLKGINEVSGVALRLMFLGPEMKAMKKEALTYGIGFTRRNNLLKQMLKVVDVKNAKKYDTLDMDIQFQSPLPQNIVETVQYLTAARGGEAIISEETALRNNPMVDDVNDEIDRLSEERDRNAVNRVAGSFDIINGGAAGNVA